MNDEQRCKDILRSCGVELADNKPPILHTSAMMFKYRLGEAVRNDSTIAQAIGDHVDTLLSNHSSITAYLDPVEVPSSEGGDEEGDAAANAHRQHAQPGAPQSESIVRLMLGIDALQPRLIGTLLEKFPEFIGDEDDQSSTDPGGTKTSVKILRQLRWLDYVVDSAGLTERLLDTLSFVPPEMQSEIICALPDIISDSDHAEVSKALAAMLTDTPGLMLPILETLGSLECTINLLQECRNSVVVHLLSAEPADLPVMVKFLLQSVTPETAAPTIQRIRRRLDLDSVVIASRQVSNSADDQTPDVLIFDVISTCLRCHKHLRDAWLKTISADTAEVGSHTTLDIVVLLILHQVTTQTKRVEAILKSKINAVSTHPVAYTPEVMESTIAKFPAVFSAQFPALLSVSSWLIRTSPLGSQASRVAASMVAAAFGSMGMFQRQEISGELAVHIGSGNANEIDTASRICLQLAQRYPLELRPFAIFIKGLLDYVDNLSAEHMRLIFDTLGILSTLSTSGGDDSMFSDLYIFVRKQLSSVYPKYNRIGIVGTVSLLRQLGTKDNTVHARHAASLDPSTAGGGGSSQAPSANIQALRRAVQLLEMLMDTGRHQSWAFISMAYDELAHVVETKGLHPQLLTWLHENVSSKFATHFLGDAELLAERYSLPGRPSIALSLDDEEPTILDILNHNKDAADLGLHRAAKRSGGGGSMDGEGGTGKSPKLRGCLLSCLPSLLRLIQVCEKALSDGSLTEIDALLVCGMYLLPPVDPSTAGSGGGADAAAAGSSDSQTAPQYTLVAGDDGCNDSSLLIAGDSLVGVNEDSRAELLSKIRTWQPELRRILCTSLYAASSWIREIINAFAGQPTLEVRGKVVQRVNQLSQIEGDLESLASTLSSTPSEFNPLAAGLVPEVTDTAAVRTIGGPVPRIGKGSANADEHGTQGDQDSGAQTREEQAAAYFVDIDGLLLSQDDTRRFVDESFETDGPASSTRRRGRKRKDGAANSASSAADDFAKAPHQFLRELSLSAFDILVANAEDDSDGQQPLISARGLDLLLRELGCMVNAKLARHPERRSPWHRQQSGGGGSLATFSSNIASSSADDIAKRLLHILPSLLKYLTCCLAIRARFRNDVDIAGHADTELRIISGVDTLDDIVVIEQCIDTLLQILSTVLQWDGLQGSSGRAPVEAGGQAPGQRASNIGRNSIMVSVLGALAEQGSHTDHGELADLDTDVLVRRAFDCLMGFADMVAITSRVISILRMLVSIRSFARHSKPGEELQCMTTEQRESTMDGMISTLARRILASEWSGMGETKPTDLEYIITQHIMRYPHSRVELTHEYATQILTGFASGSADSSAEAGHSSLRNSTFATYYKAVTQILAQTIRDAHLGEMNGRDILRFSTMVAESWLALTKITQKMDGTVQRSILLIALRGGYMLVDLFTKTILPLLDNYFLIHRNEILVVFNRVQKSTRILQNICNHSKVAKDTKLQAAVPQMKRKLESLIFQVIALMEHNDCMGAINLGNLKHRDLRGQIVSSQIPLSQEEQEDEEDEDGSGLGIDIELAYAGSGAEEGEEEGEEDAPPQPQPASRAKRGRGSRSGTSGRPPPLPTAASKQKERVQRR